MGSHTPLAATGSVSSYVEDGVADVCFGHPKSNSLPSLVLRGLAEEIAAVGLRDDVRVVTLRSYGTGAFCAGASFDELASIRDKDAGKEFFLGFARVILAMTRCAKPIVTRVHGKAVGGGVGIVAASDYAIATENAALRLSELAVGIGPFVVGPAIERKVGPGPFAAMALDADWRDGHWGERHGLYSQLCATPTDLDAAVTKTARTLSQANPTAVQRIKEIAWSGTEHWPTLLDQRAEMSGTLVLSEYTRTAIAKFVRQ
ncbi:MAG TPA: enoyl-CoA hydratase/isomerase family protein [Gemmatimonadaceae bacterium]|jgi:methylglutaconyl-CoA hydratase|nr:enoyl-CoA hydratase/isomerase family protein [Gemmatimonadaceae bacterium]